MTSYISTNWNYVNTIFTCKFFEHTALINIEIRVLTAFHRKMVGVLQNRQHGETTMWTGCREQKQKVKKGVLPPSSRRVHWRDNRRGGVPRPRISRLFHSRAGRTSRNWSSPSAPANQHTSHRINRKPIPPRAARPATPVFYWTPLYYFHATRSVEETK